MLEGLLLSAAKTFLSKDLVKRIVFALLDKVAEDIVESTEDEVGKVTLDEAIVLIKNRIKIIINDKI